MESCCGGWHFHASFGILLMELFWQAQAFDRVHRIGQTKDVHVYKIKTNNTIEDRILAVSIHSVRALGIYVNGLIASVR